MSAQWESMVSAEERRSAFQREYGSAQAAAETLLLRRVGNRYATVSLTQGHRPGFWDGVQWMFDRLTRGFDALTGPELIRELRKGDLSLYWPVLVDDDGQPRKVWLLCDHCRTRQLFDTRGICDHCGTEME